MQAVLRQTKTASILRGLFPILVLGLCLTALSGRFGPDLWFGLPGYLNSVPWHIWCLALMFTGLSFFALGTYDVLAHQHLNSGTPRKAARITGMTSIALSQTLGFGLITGAVCRWRMLEGLSFPRAVAVTALVSASFLFGLGIVMALTAVVLPASDWMKQGAVVVLILLPALALVLLRWPRITLGPIHLQLPNLFFCARAIIWTFVDTLAAAAALWLFLPETAGISFDALFPVYLIALFTALLCNTPGGVGPFELVLLTAFPQVPPDELLQSIIAFRLVYYACPAVLGMMALIRPFPAENAVVPKDRFCACPKARSETGVIRQNGARIVPTPDGALAIWQTPHTETALFGTLDGTPSAGMAALRKCAQRTGRLPLLYKCNARDAVAAREAGMSVCRTAEDAVIDTATFTLDSPSRRGLRRKLRAARKAGVEVHVPKAPPFEDLQRIDREWCLTKGGARAGTMGRYCDSHVADQWVAVAYCEGYPVAFVTFFAEEHDWSLDLIRQDSSAPNGTIYLLLAHAIACAKAAGVREVSLAAVPPSKAPRGVPARLWSWVYQRGGYGGLRQFKAQFAPEWRPRYSAAPGPFRLAFALTDIACRVHFPQPDTPSS